MAGMQLIQSLINMILFVRSAKALGVSTCSRMSTTTKLFSSLTTDKEVINNMLYRIRKVNELPDDIRSSLTSFQVDGVELGKVRPAMVEKLVGTNVFELQDSYLTLVPSAGSTCESRTAAVASVMQDLRNQGIITGWRDELYPMSRSFYEAPIFLMERAAVPLLGGLEYGVHLNGLVKYEDNNIRMWIARRAKTKATYGGMLDHMVAGGQPAGMSLMDNVIKECLEEAGVPEEVTRLGIKAAGAISYETYQPKKDVISRAVLFCYDLWLPRDFQPIVVDGEVEDFVLWTLDQVKESMARDFHDPIKPNCYPVIVDFLLRGGHVSPDTPGYLDVLRELRNGACQ
jgi:isopentenyldiphosphate isomerase